MHLFLSEVRFENILEQYNDQKVPLACDLDHLDIRAESHRAAFWGKLDHQL